MTPGSYCQAKLLGLHLERKYKIDSQKNHSLKPQKIHNRREH